MSACILSEEVTSPCKRTLASSISFTETRTTICWSFTLLDAASVPVFVTFLGCFSVWILLAVSQDPGNQPWDFYSSEFSTKSGFRQGVLRAILWNVPFSCFLYGVIGVQCLFTPMRRSLWGERLTLVLRFIFISWSSWKISLCSNETWDCLERGGVGKHLVVVSYTNKWITRGEGRHFGAPHTIQRALLHPPI